MYSNRIEATYSRFYYNDVVFMIISYKTTVNAEVPNYYAINYQKNMTHFVGCDAFFSLPSSHTTVKQIEQSRKHIMFAYVHNENRFDFFSLVPV